VLTIVNGPLFYDDIKIVVNITYPTLKKFCFASGFSANDT